MSFCRVKKYPVGGEKFLRIPLAKVTFLNELHFSTLKKLFLIFLSKHTVKLSNFRKYLLLSRPELFAITFRRRPCNCSHPHQRPKYCNLPPPQGCPWPISPPVEHISRNMWPFHPKFGEGRKGPENCEKIRRILKLSKSFYPYNTF